MTDLKYCVYLNCSSWKTRIAETGKVIEKDGRLVCSYCGNDYGVPERLRKEVANVKRHNASTQMGSR